MRNKFTCFVFILLIFYSQYSASMKVNFCRDASWSHPDPIKDVTRYIVKIIPITKRDKELCDKTPEVPRSYWVAMPGQEEVEPSYLANLNYDETYIDVTKSGGETHVTGFNLDSALMLNPESRTIYNILHTATEYIAPQIKGKNRRLKGQYTCDVDVPEPSVTYTFPPPCSRDNHK